MPYADKNQLIADYLPEATSDEEIAAVGRILDAVSSWVDSYCKRAAGYFAPGTSNGFVIRPATMKRVRGEGRNFLRLPVHVPGSITQIDGTDFTAWSARASPQSLPSASRFSSVSLLVQLRFGGH